MKVLLTPELKKKHVVYKLSMYIIEMLIKWYLHKYNNNNNNNNNKYIHFAILYYAEYIFTYIH